MPPDTTLDPDLVAFIEAQPRGTPYSRIAELLRQRFGQARAVDEATLRTWWQATHPTHERRVIDRDRDVREAILDLAGRLTGREIMEALAVRFAPARLPSRSALYRFLSEARTSSKGRHDCP